MRGSVEAFDAAGGWGEIRVGGEEADLVPFHCTAIADGTRNIVVGVEVAFHIVAGRAGRWEAAEITLVG